MIYAPFPRPLVYILYSSGLESSTKHGLVPSTCTPSQTRPSALEPFLLHSLRAHARSTLSFVAGAHTIASIPPPSPLDPTRQRFSPGSSTASWKADQLGLLDAAYEAFTSNHITRRGSKTQGAGMLSLWSKSLKKPAYLVQKGTEEDEASELMEELRRRIRAGTLEGHLPVCWGVLCGVLGLSKGEDFGTISPSFSFPCVRKHRSYSMLRSPLFVNHLPLSSPFFFLSLSLFSLYVILFSFSFSFWLFSFSSSSSFQNERSTCTCSCTLELSFPPLSDSTKSVLTTPKVFSSIPLLPSSTPNSKSMPKRRTKAT